MTKPTYSTLWLVNGKRIDDPEEMRRLVLGGAIAEEVSVEQQQETHERQQLLNQWHAETLERANKIIAEYQHKQSPDGQK